jgi:hypothetical protein
VKPSTLACILILAAPTVAKAQGDWSAQQAASRDSSRRAYDSVWAEVATQHRPDSLRAAKVTRDSLALVKARAARANAKRDAQRRADGWTAADFAAVRAHAVKVGMNSDMVKAAVGFPDDINSTETASGTRYQWVYRYRGMYVYFVDGTVAAIQR